MRLLPLSFIIQVKRFQSTHRVSDATRLALDKLKKTGISIHAPRERCDETDVTPVWIVGQFQSTHRVSDATSGYVFLTDPKTFQSTHRVSDATYSSASQKSESIISIHAPRERCDVLPIVLVLIEFISIHAPRERCDS